MRRLFIVGACTAAWLVATPMQAHPADHLDCMAQPYAAKDQIVVDTYVNGFSTRGSKGPDMAPLMSMLSERAGICADQYAWSPQAIMNAVFHQFGAAMELGLRSKSALTPADLVRLEKAITAADQDRLWGTLERMMGLALSGDAEAASDGGVDQDDETYLGLVIISSGIPLNDTNSEFAGALLASQAIQRLASKRFDSE